MSLETLISIFSSTSLPDKETKPFSFVSNGCFQNIGGSRFLVSKRGHEKNEIRK